jgi:hypothetical protein
MLFQQAPFFNEVSCVNVEALGIFSKVKVSRKYVFKFNFQEFSERIVREYRKESDLV